MIESIIDMVMAVELEIRYIESCRILASMLLCLIHILVRAEPMSLVPPANTNQTALISHK